MQSSSATLFQLTTSRRGRRQMKNSIELGIDFQLTTSRRGRPNADCLLPPLFTFNSRPHAEVDFQARIDAEDRKSFNSRPHAEVDNLFSLLVIRLLSFNSRPHAEVDINISHILCKISILFLIFFAKTTLNKVQKYEYYFIFAKINC